MARDYEEMLDALALSEERSRAEAGESMPTGIMERAVWDGEVISEIPHFHVWQRVPGDTSNFRVCGCGENAWVVDWV